MTNKHLISIVFVSFTVFAARSQGVFQDLNFESANPVSAGNPNDPTQVTFTSALPGWSGSIDGVAATTVELNDLSLGAPSIDLLGPGWQGVEPGIIGGDYTVFLQAFFPSEGNVSLWQNGTVPANTASIQFSAWSQYSPVNLLVSFAGNDLSLVTLSSGTSPSGLQYDVYGANLTSYAGRSGQLEFTTFANTQPGQIELDDISFSTTTVPEPNPLALTGAGALLFALYRRFAHQRP